MDLIPSKNTELEKIITSEFEFFEPDNKIEIIPSYNNQETQELSDIINKNKYCTFYIDSILKNKTNTRNEDEILNLKGHYKTFDGIQINITFEGIYGNPEKPSLFEKLNKEDAFKSYKINCDFDNTNTNKFQERILNSISLRDKKRFNNCKLYKDHNFILGKHSDGSSSAGLDQIRKIGKIINLYNNIHTRDKWNEVVSEYFSFKKNMKKLNITGPIDIKIAEYQNDMDTLSPIHEKIMNASYEFMAMVTFQINSTTQNSSAMVNYRIEDNDIQIEYRNPLLNKYFNDSNSNPKNNSKKQKRKLIRFILNCGSFRIHDDDFVDTSYIMHEDFLLRQARDEIKKNNPEYTPIAKTLDESNRIKISNDWDDSYITTTIKSVSDYQFLDKALEIVSVLNKNELSIDNLLLDDNLNNIIEQNPELKNRVFQLKIQYEKYKDDPFEAYQSYLKQDPAINLAKEMAESEDKKE